MEMVEGVKEEIISAQNDGDWKKCIFLCKKALNGNISCDASDLYGIKISLALALICEEENLINGCEEAIDIYKDLIHSAKKDSTEWGQLQKNIGIAYAKRIKGNKDKNLLKSISYYKKSLATYEKIKDEKTWASIKAEIGFAYMKLREGSIANNAIDASKNFKEALKIFNKSKHQEEWREITESLNVCEKRIKNH
jgi:tetratricopeptide (TPR) repeat protein